MRKTSVLVAAVATAGIVVLTGGAASATAQSMPLSTPYGTLTSDAWRMSGDGWVSGNTRQWNYQVTASVGGSQSVEQIKSTWTGGASLRNSANFSVSAGMDSVSVGGGSSWQYTSQTKYWLNTNGSRTATYTSNMIATPSDDYRSGSISLANTAFVKFSGDARNWQITASV